MGVIRLYLPSITLQVVGGDAHFVWSVSPTMSRNSNWVAVVTSRQQICEVVPFWRGHDCIEEGSVEALGVG